MSIFPLFKKSLPEPIRDLGIIEGSPYGDVSVDEWDDDFRFRPEEFGLGPCFIRPEGDQLRFTSLFRNHHPNGYIEFAIWVLNDPEVRKIMNKKARNNPNMKFTACFLFYEDIDRTCKRGMTIFPDDTVESALRRYEEVWYSQPRFGGCIDDDFSYKMNY